MDLSRFRHLTKNRDAGTISDDEAKELETCLDDWAAKQFKSCPVCRGAFTTIDLRRTQDRCPNCDTQLYLVQADIVGHGDWEIDTSIEPQSKFGVFSAGYIAAGTAACFCGEVYPKNYSACPGLIIHAIAMTESKRTTSPELAVRFIDAHSTTLLNSLRGEFATKFNRRSRKILNRIATKLKCCEELLDALSRIE